jgi:hypothetical protein
MQQKQRTRRTYSADRYRHQLHHARRYSAGAEWRRRRDSSETEDEDHLNEHLARCKCTCDHMGYTSSSQHHTQVRCVGMISVKLVPLIREGYYYLTILN